MPGTDDPSTPTDSTGGGRFGADCSARAHPRTQRLYGFRDILVLKIVKRLLDAGISLQQIRQAVSYLRNRGIAELATLTLVSDGATVYVTGRSVRGEPTTNDWPETIDDTAEMVTARGGVGIPVRVDHAIDEEVEAFFERVRQEYCRIDE